jgi:hypothetical protein
MAEEEPFAFSLATAAQRTMAAALGVFNFVGVGVLSRLLLDPVIIAKKATLAGGSFTTTTRSTFCFSSCSFVYTPV